MRADSADKSKQDALLLLVFCLHIREQMCNYYPFVYLYIISIHCNDKTIHRIHILGSMNEQQ